jgi:lambda repressor-like predicted transcriptional regulator
MGTFAREKIFNGKLPEAKLARVDLQTYLELKKMGVNLNQLTRLANMGMGGRALANVLMQLIQQQEQIISLLLHYDSKPENR